MAGEALLSSGGYRRFLQEHFRKPADLSSLPSLVAQLECECDDDEEEILHLKKRISLAFSSWIFQSTEVGRILSGIQCSSPCPSRVSDGSVSPYEKIIDVELPLLAKEVGLIRSVRLYAETTLHLESLVGDLEDAASSMIMQFSRKDCENNLSRSPQQTVAEDGSGRRLEKLREAMKAMKEIEEVLSDISSKRTHWNNLPKAVDFRVEKALAILRPQCVTDHRTLIASLGWPPPLSTINVEKDRSMQMLNPLLRMQGQTKDNYCQSFVSLCLLQYLQAKRETRVRFLLRHQPEDSNPSYIKEAPFFKCTIWPIDELVKPIFFHMEGHFSRWLDQPKFIFALVYKITHDLIDGVETILQPLIDKARLMGCSAKEAWVVAMVKMLSGYIKRQVFPSIVQNLSASSLLHMVDLMITFDKRIKLLISSGMFTSIDEFAPMSSSIMSIFCERSDWLQLWADLELDDAESKLRHQTEDASSWLIVLRGKPGSYDEKEESFLFSCSEDYKAPLIADPVVRLAREMIERGSSLPCSGMRKQFISSSANLFLSRFLGSLLDRIKDIDYIAAVLDDVQLLKVCSSMNAAQYCEHVLHEWSEDVNLTGIFEPSMLYSLYVNEAKFLANLQTGCLEEIVTALLLHFDSLSRSYVQDVYQWVVNEDEAYLCVTPSFIQALDMVMDRIQCLKRNLNSPTFMDLWRSMAGGLDHFIFAVIPMSDASFSSQGILQFRTDMNAIFTIFRPFCARPEAFFPCISNSLKLLEASERDVDQMLEILSEDYLRIRGIFHVSLSQAVKILRNRIPSG